MKKLTSRTKDLAEAVELLLDHKQSEERQEALFRSLSSDPELLTKHPYNTPSYTEVEAAQKNAMGCVEVSARRVFLLGEVIRLVRYEISHESLAQQQPYVPNLDSELVNG